MNRAYVAKLRQMAMDEAQGETLRTLLLAVADLEERIRRLEVNVLAIPEGRSMRGKFSTTTLVRKD